MTFYEIENGRQRLLVAIPTVLTALALMFTSMRVYARRLQKTRVLIDDYLCIGACIFGLGLLGLNIAMLVTTGNGKSKPELKDPKDLYLWYKFSFITYLFWVVNIAIVQLAILAFYQRMFWVVTWFRRSCYGLMAVSITWCVALFIAQFTICIPRDKIWGGKSKGRCGDTARMCRALGLTHTILDFLVLFVPVPLIWGMRISFRKKIAVTFLFMAGIFASLASLLRLQCLLDASEQDPNDIVRNTWIVWMYYFVEVPIAIICCSASCTPTVYKHVSSTKVGKYTSTVFGHWFSSFSSRSQSEEKQSGDPPQLPVVNDTTKQGMELQTHGLDRESSST